MNKTFFQFKSIIILKFLFLFNQLNLAFFNLKKRHKLISKYHLLIIKAIKIFYNIIIIRLYNHKVIHNLSI